jgi:hypothetical protein
VNAAFGAATARRLAERTCRSSECGGPRFCLHRHLGDVSREAALEYARFDVPSPADADDDDVPHALGALRALLSARAPPVDWVRCGVTAERLAVLGVSLDDLVRHAGYLLEDVVEALELDWERLGALRFHPSALVHREHYPVVVLARAGLSAERLAAFALSYKDLVTRYSLTHEELAFLGFDAPLLVHLGMSGTDVFAALEHPHVRERGARWWTSALGATPELLARLFASTNIAALADAHKLAYVSLTAAARALAAC